jgi:group I intron endonuclease
MEYYIYETKNDINGKFYIGQHKGELNDSYIGSGKILHNAVRKYGKQNFTKTVIEICSKDNLNEREIYWIDRLKPQYNITSGGTGGNTWFGVGHPDESVIYEKRYGKEGKLRFSESIQQTYKDRPELLEEKSERMKLNNPTDSQEVRNKISESLQTGWAEGLYEHVRSAVKHAHIGSHHTDEQKQNLSIKAKEMWSPGSERLLKRNAKIRDAWDTNPELKERQREISMGANNPNFKWIYIMKRDNRTVDTFGYSLDQWVKLNPEYNLKVSSIQHAAAKRILASGWSVERFHKDEYGKLGSK